MHLGAPAKEDAWRSDAAGGSVPPLARFCTPGRVSPAALLALLSSGAFPRTCRLRTCAGASAAAAGDPKSL